MASENVDVVNQWRTVDFADRAAVSDVLTDDVEWVFTERGESKILHGIDAVLAWYGGPQERPGTDNLDVTEERGDLEDVGSGRVVATGRLVFTWKESGDVAYVRPVRVTYDIHHGKIARYEREWLPDEPSS
jgi:hypothetical protein